MVLFSYVLMCLIYGTTFLCIRIGDVAGMPPLLFAAIRFGSAGAITILFSLIASRHLFPRNWRVYARLCVTGLFTTTGVFSIVYEVETRVPSGYAAIVSALMPFAVVVLGLVFYRQRYTGIQYVGMLCAFLGVVVVALPGIEERVSGWLLMTAGLLVAQFFAAFGALQSRAILDTGVSPFVVNGFQLFFGGLGLFVLSLVAEPFSLRGVHDVGAAIGSLAYLTLFGSLIGSTLFYVVVARVGTVIASTWTYVSPVVALFVGHFVLGEKLYLSTLVGTAIILGGVCLLNVPSFRAKFSPTSSSTLDG